MSRTFASFLKTILFGFALAFLLKIKYFGGRKLLTIDNSFFSIS